jgi:hypothetical protein
MRPVAIIMTVYMLLSYTAAYTQNKNDSTELILDEDFMGSNNNWPIINHGDTAFTKLTDGHYILNVRNANRFWALRMQPLQIVARPTELEIRLMATSIDDAAYYGIIFNVVKKASDIFDEFRFLISKDGYYAVVERVDGHNVVHVRGTSCSCVKDHYNVLRVSKTADSVHRFYINDRQVYQKKLTFSDLFTFGFYVDAHSVLFVDRVKMSIKR